jgi:gamma-glutamyltranspeptidase / glutathione hydrolase
MTARQVPFHSARGNRCVVAAADQLATQAGMSAFARGGNAVDAAIAANAAIAVTGPHLCGMGGDLFAIVSTPGGDVVGLNASGRAGSGADAAAMRAEGLVTMPFRGDLRSVTIPGCVDGWIALHERFGLLALDAVLAPAIRLAAGGFPAGPLLALVVTFLDNAGKRELHELVDQAVRPGARVRRPGVALTLQAISRGGRAAFYGGAFGEGLVHRGAGLFSEADLQQRQADWVDVLTIDVFGVELCSLPPNSQGYLTLATTRLAADAGLPTDPDEALWAHLLIEAATAAGYDRPARLHDKADGAELVAEVIGRAELLDLAGASRRPASAAEGDTTYLCTADADGWAVSLIQSNASGFGSCLVEPTTSINLQNRGLGFSLVEGHPAELKPGRQPPHTLCPALVRRDARVAAVLGTMGGDAQPQILAQLVARLFHAEEPLATAVAAPRWVLRGPETGFDTWTGPLPPTVVIEDGASPAWIDGLRSRGHEVATARPFDGATGHANAIVIEPNGTFCAAADPRALIGAAAAL